MYVLGIWNYVILLILTLCNLFVLFSNSRQECLPTKLFSCLIIFWFLRYDYFAVCMMWFPVYLEHFPEFHSKTNWCAYKHKTFIIGCNNFYKWQSSTITLFGHKQHDARLGKFLNIEVKAFPTYHTEIIPWFSRRGSFPVAAQEGVVAWVRGHHRKNLVAWST